MDILAAEFKKMGSTDIEDTEDFSNKRAKQYLLVMVQRWEINTEPIKIVVARYVVGDGISSDYITRKFREVIIAHYKHKSIVNNVTADRASNNPFAFELQPQFPWVKFSQKMRYN